jgi:hypothetical protein
MTQGSEGLIPIFKVSLYEKVERRSIKDKMTRITIPKVYFEKGVYLLLHLIYGIMVSKKDFY